jgi:hypothetical protein
MRAGHRLIAALALVSAAHTARAQALTFDVSLDDDLTFAKQLGPASEGYELAQHLILAAGVGVRALTWQAELFGGGEFGASRRWIWGGDVAFPLHRWPDPDGREDQHIINDTWLSLRLGARFAGEPGTSTTLRAAVGIGSYCYGLEIGYAAELVSLPAHAAVLGGRFSLACFGALFGLPFVHL